MANRSLTGKVVIVTGSSAGIGKVIAVEAASRGAKLVVNSRKAERLEEVAKEIERLGSEVLPVAANLRDPEQVQALVEKSCERFGRVDVLVNNAGGRFLAAPEEISPNGWRAVLETNLDSAFMCARAVLPIMREQGGGRIVSIGSVAGEGAYPRAAHYGAAKAGLANLTATLGVEWARHNIQVNCVVPGAIMTDASSFADPAVREKVEAELPGGRIGTPEDIAEVVLFLADMEGTYLTGQTIRVDGALQGTLPTAPEQSPVQLPQDKRSDDDKAS